MKILYLMHVDWNWIKQRPHFIAEKLQDNGIDVEVYYSKYFYKDKLTKNERGNLRIKQIPRLPLSRFSFVKKINQCLYKNLIKRLQKRKYDYIYVTHPSLYIKEMKTPIIYDCMDDVLAFSDDKVVNEKTFNTEKELILNAKIVLFTAQNLMDTAFKRYGLERDGNKYFVNNNAIELPAAKKIEKFDLGNTNKIKLTYIGTITEWFDFDLLEKLDAAKYEIHLFGPIYNINQQFQSNFIIHGTVPRDKIFSIMNSSDILMMPFKVTELIKSVNPVKLYEYIYSCKPIVAVRYGESEKFLDFVYLYESGNFEDFSACLKSIEQNEIKNKCSADECLKFVESNTWNSRTEEIIRYLHR